RNYHLVVEQREFLFAVVEACQTCVCPFSSVASERAWSIMDLIQLMKHKRLTTAKTRMLAFIYVNPNAVSSDPPDWVRLHSYSECS
ncbi:hypothetical protein PHYSODRAFT_515811, partial [Phytophthora sojae]